MPEPMVKLTSPAGVFVFNRSTPLSLMKLIRDAVTSQVMSPNKRYALIRSGDDARAHIAENALISDYSYYVKREGEFVAKRKTIPFAFVRRVA